MATPEADEGPPLPGPVVGLAEQRQGLLAMYARVGPVALPAARKADIKVRPGLAGQVTGPPEVVQGLPLVDAVLAMSASNVPYLPIIAWVQPSAVWSPAASAAASTAWPTARKSAQYP